MTQELRERVARAACDAVNGDGAYDETGTLHREKVWHPAADAAIAVVLEEAAKMLEARWAYGTADHQAAAIRALKDKP